MNTSFDIAQQTLLQPFDLTESHLQQVLQQMMSPGVDYADIYLQYSQHEMWLLEEGIIKNGTFTIDQGVGVRATSGEKTGYAYTDDLRLAPLIEAAKYAKSIVNAGQTGVIQATHKVTGNDLYPLVNPLGSLTDDAKIQFLQLADKTARQCDPRVIQVNASISGSYKVVLIVASDGSLAADVRPLIMFNVSVLVEEHGVREHGMFGGGGRLTYHEFLTAEKVQQYAREAVRIALVNLAAIPSPAGLMPVVLGHGWPAVMLHEAVGHGLEADFNRKQSSVYAGKIGQQVASPLCTVVDQGNLPGERRGTTNIDDEGTPTQATTLIEQGVLVGYMQDKLNARLMGARPTGNGRRSSYANMPIPRMTVTYFRPGPHDPQEIIASVDKGIYAVNFSGGQVDITSGEFVFSTSEAYLIEKGKVTQPVKGVTLTGNGPQVLHKITMMGNDLTYDEGVGVCGKDGQSVAVGVGQPTLKISELIVGGTAIEN